MDQVKQLFKNTLIFGIGNIGSKLIQFIAVPMFTVFLTTKEYGEADLMTTIVSLALPFFSLCLYDAILRFIIDWIEVNI
ncbi:oligosaccharide flippase family protein [Lactiplantibacillus plantarum]|uniref:oligosaccharide flippase family protein n=1 Tax=Lactiplantibacillus plantarum TaxID=1590 RepID=UPI001897C681|nr:oligosaccharide flippase family protein [Lactiplantibacillus plantarum]